MFVCLFVHRERLLLVDPANSTAITKQFVALVVGHELAHQWFGNLVSVKKYKKVLIYNLCRNISITCIVVQILSNLCFHKKKCYIYFY